VLERPTTVSRAPRRRERHARYRQRVKAGRMVALVELGRDELDWLVSVRWLTPQEADAGDARIIGERIAAGIAASAKG
jgi:hypothetical protein